MSEPESAVQRMNKELFGVFDDSAVFEQFRSSDEFDVCLAGPDVTVGVRSSEIGIPGRTSVHETDEGICVLWGEVYPESIDELRPARWVLSEYAERGADALTGLDGSCIAVVDRVDEAGIVATDCTRSRECNYSDTRGTRVFGTDPATVAQTVADPTLADEPLLEFLHFGVVLGERTVLNEVQRIPFDSWLTAADTHEFGRFVYRPREFDYASELAERLHRALKRRRGLPGRKGVLLSGGYDSRTILAGIPEMDVAYTLGDQDSSELTVAGGIADQYGTAHRTLPVDERYLNTSAETIRYGHGIMEAVHIHHGGYTDQMDVDTVFHGALADTILRGHFQPVDGVEVFDRKCPPYRLDPDPDMESHIAEKLGVLPDSEVLCSGPHSVDERGAEFRRRRVNEELDGWKQRCETVYDEMALFGIMNQPTRPFRYQLSDQFIESCVPLDAELIQWHLATPPEHRRTKTYLRAIRKLDGDILRHRPPDRPYDSFTVNQIGSFLRRAVPSVSGYQGPWPDREQLYRKHGLDREIFAEEPNVAPLSWRLKLRINDITTWLETTVGESPFDPSDLVQVQGELPKRLGRHRSA